MFALALISVLAAIVICCENKLIKPNQPTITQQQELKKINEQQPLEMKIQQRKQHLQQVKKMNRQIIKDMRSKRKDLI